MGNPSAFGSLISAGKGGDGTLTTGGAGGTVIKAGNIFAYNGQAGSNADEGSNELDGAKGGDAGAVTPWSVVQAGAGQGFLPFPNAICSGGKRGVEDASNPGTETPGGAGLFGGGDGGAYYYYTTAARPGAGGGGYGGGGQGGKRGRCNKYKDSAISHPGKGAKGIVIVEYCL